MNDDELIWICLDHPCMEIDVWRWYPESFPGPPDNYIEDYEGCAKHARGQGYMTLKELRELVEKGQAK